MKPAISRPSRTSSTPPTSPLIVQRQTMSGQVAQELKRRILAGELADGSQLRQEQLASEFGISKVPVREALHQLEAEGFLVQQFHRGFVVAGLSPDQIMEIFELRTQIEIWLIDVAMANATKEDIAQARELADLIGESSDEAGYPEMNWRFHEALYRPANRLFALDYVKKLHTQIERYVRLQFSIALRKDQVLKEHDELLKLYSRKDPQTKECLRQHILGSAKSLTERLQKINLKLSV